MSRQTYGPKKWRSAAVDLVFAQEVSRVRPRFLAPRGTVLVGPPEPPSGYIGCSWRMPRPARLDAAAVSKLLRELAQRLELAGGNPYRARAYSRPAENLLPKPPPPAPLHAERIG